MVGVAQAKLDFPEKLLQSGKKENTDALLKRLKTLHQKLKSLEQDLVDTRSLNPVVKPLISNVILHHKDRGVKAFAACCIADILRLTAPEAPYSPDEIRDILQFFSTQLVLHLKVAPSTIKPLQPSRTKTNEASQLTQTQLGPQSQRITDVAYYTEYYYLLESLATIQTVVLAVDCPDGDDIVTGFYTGFVELVRPDMNKGLLKHLIDILVLLAQEAQTIPSGVLDCIMSQFENFQSDGQFTPAFQLIVAVCNQAPDRFKRPFFAHFSEIQLSHGKNPSPSDLKALENAHALMLTIYRHCPELMSGVIQQLEENLKAVDEIPIRQLSTKTLGQMFGERPVVGSNIADLGKAYPNAWKSWLGRRVDKALAVRLNWVEAARGILNGHELLRGELEAALCDRFEDSDDRVRAAVCKLFGTLDYEIALHHIQTSTLKAVGTRLSDKKSAVRAEAANALTKLWKLALSEIEAGDTDAIRQFGWIPQQILRSAEGPVELMSQMTAIFYSKILPLPKPDAVNEEAWTDRLLLVASHLDELAFRALERVTGLKGFSRGASPYRAWIEMCEKNNAGIIDGEDAEVKVTQERLAFVTKAIASQCYGDSEKARKDLEAFAEANENKLHKCFKVCADPTSDLKAIVKHRHDFLRRIEQAHPDILETMTTLIDNAAWNIVNTSSISPLLKRLSSSAAAGNAVMSISEAAYKLLYLMAKEGAPMWKSHIPALVLLLGEKKNPKAVEIALQGLAAVCKAEAEAAPDDRRAVDRGLKIALTGTPRQAKFAARFIAFSKHPQAANELIKSLLEELDSEDEKLLLTHLAALSELALSSPAAFEKKSDAIVKFVLKEVMLKQSPSAEDIVDDEWVESSQLQVLDRAKLIGMRIVTHRSLAFCTNADALSTVEPTFKLLKTVLQNDGMVDESTSEGGRARQHMKLRAALCSLKLAKARVFDKHIDAEYFELIAATLQEVVYQVRNTFLLKLRDVLPAQRLLPRWNILPALVACDPMKDNLAIAKHIMQGVARQCAGFATASRIDRVELPFARLLLLCSHTPDQEDEFSLEDMKPLAKIIDFFLEAIANRDNVSLLYHIATRLKIVKDPDAKRGDASFEDPKKYEALDKSRVAGEMPADKEEREEKQRDMLLQHPSANLWRMSEVAQALIQAKAKQHQWPVTSYPRSINLPSDVFCHVVIPDPEKGSEGAKWAKTKNMEMVQRIQKTQFLDEEMLNWAKSGGRRGAGGGIARRAAAPREANGEGSSPSKKRKPTKAGGRKKRRRTEESDDDDDEESEEEEGEDEDMKGEEEDEDELEEEEGEGVVGRGGKRGAKTKARKAVSKKKKARSSPTKSTPRGKKGKTADTDSELSDEE